MEDKRVGKQDLHIHTIYSDGSNTPAEIVTMAENLKLEVISITDHDSIEGTKQALSLRNLHISVIPGIEITAFDKNLPSASRMHILGYGFNPDNYCLNRLMEKLRDNSRNTFQLYIDLLATEFNIHFNSSDILEIMNREGDINRNDIAKLLIEYGYISQSGHQKQMIDEAFHLYLNPIYKLSHKKKQTISPEQAISTIIDANGISILAHPGSLKQDYHCLENKLQELKYYGLMGVEKFHIHNDPSMVYFLEQMIEKYNFLYSGGSDYHGSVVKPKVILGSGSLEENEYQIQIMETSVVNYLRLRRSTQ